MNNWKLQAVEKNERDLKVFAKEHVNFLIAKTYIDNKPKEKIGNLK